MSKRAACSPRFWCVFIIVFLAGLSAWAQEAEVNVWHREITVFRTYVADISPQERAGYAVSRLEMTPNIELRKGPKTSYKSHDGKAAVGFSYGDHFLFYLHEEDLLPGEDLKRAESEVIGRLQQYADAQVTQRQPQRVLKGVAAFLVASLVLFLCMKMLALYRRWIARFFDKGSLGDKRVVFLGVDFSSEIGEFVKKVLMSLSWICLAVLGYIYVVLVLRAFPYTEVWGQKLGHQVTDVTLDLLSSFLKSIPDLFTLLVIFLIVRGLNHLIKFTFNSLETSQARGKWLDEDTRKATRRVLTIMVWVFGVVVAYPYIPGSDSEAFKGVSVLIGLMVSLGSTGLVNQIVAGFVVLYSGAVRSGEYVHMGDVEGTLTEVGLLSCKVLTPRGEFVTVPNAVIMSDKTVNFSRLSKQDGAVFATSITIGYDAHWRTVHNLLEEAAESSDQIKKSPKPRVIQEELGDFAVKYTLVFNVDEPQRKPQILTELHSKIQDGFARSGIQIMSPHFNSQPEELVMPPKGK